MVDNKNFTKRQLISVMYRAGLNLASVDAVWKEVQVRQSRRAILRGVHWQQRKRRYNPTPDFSIPLTELYND